MGVLLVGCGKGAGERKEDNGHEEGGHAEHGGEIVLEPEVAKESGVRTGKVKVGVFGEVIRVSGRIVAGRGGEKKVVAPAHGVIDMGGEWVGEGKAVQEGDRLMRLLSGGLAEGDVVVRTKAAYEKARREYERVQSLVEDRIVTRREYDEAEASYEAARTAYEAIVVGSGEGVEVRAPIGGYVKEVYVKEGEYVERGAELFSVLREGKLGLRAEVPGNHWEKLGRIESANFRVGNGDRVYRLEELGGKMVGYGRSVGEGGYYVPVTFEFAQRAGIVVGGYAEVWLLLEGVEERMRVPVGSLIEEQGLYWVFVKTGEEEYRKRRIWVGGSNGVEVEVIGGLEKGEEVVTSGAYVLKLASSRSAIPAHNH
jgi:RND family efflux transporter MFP subunit